MIPSERMVPVPSPDDEPTEPIAPVIQQVPRPSNSHSWQQTLFPVRTDDYKIAMILLLTMAVFVLRAIAATSSQSTSTIGTTVIPTVAPGQIAQTQALAIDQNALMAQINPPAGYPLSAKFGKLGPHLLEVGAIDSDAFVQVYRQTGQPLTNTQAAILASGSDTPVVVDSTNAYFLLNFFWAVGLANQNPILDRLLAQRGIGGVSNFASTGGWSLGAKQPMELYDRENLISLSGDQQSRLEAVASHVFRPCCGNHTAFPDCNHGMAMLGLLELMASQDATINEMFFAAKYINAFWFPEQSLEVAMYLKASQNLDFASADARTVVGEQFFSAGGFKQIHQWLTANKLLPQASGGRQSCGVQ